MGTSKNPNSVAMLRFQEKHILAEQVKLVMRNAPAGFGGAWITALLVCIALVEQVGILIWFTAYTLVSAGGLFYALRKSPAPEKSVPDNDMRDNDIRFLLVITGLGGALWGALPWVAFHPGSIASSTLILGAHAGIVGAALAMMSPWLPCYLIFLVTAVLPLSVKLLLQDELIFILLGLGCLVYSAGMNYFAKFSQAATLEAIKLRFQNADLLQQLKYQSASATAARDQALAATSAKSKFLAAASHDLRQPVHAINLFLEAMRRSGLSAQQHEIIRDAQLASLATGDMLDTLLDFSKIEAGAIKSHPRAFSLQSLFDLLENEFSAQAGQKNLIYRSRATPLAVFADPALAGQILRNLISNAIRYTHNGGALVACRTRKIGSIRYAMIEVWDTGTGIAEAQAGKIFDEFYQLGNPERDRQKGLGLGLAIVKGIAQVMETEVVLASTPGRGSVFRLRLPLAETSIVEDVPRVELATDFDRRRVLVLDDDKMVLSGMQALLSSWNCTVDCADSIEAAVQLATRHAPDLMITDFRLREGYTGHDAINALRSKISSALPAIIITGDTSPEWLRVANSMDALLLHKPVSIGLLNAAMVKVLQPATWRSHL